MKLNDKDIKETMELSELAIELEVEKIAKGKKVDVKFAKMASNMHATQEVVEAVLYSIRFGQSRQNFSPYQLGQSLPNEESEKAAIFQEKFSQPILFIPGDTYKLPKSEALKYKERFGTYQETYKEGPMFFKTEEEYQRALDTRDFVTILED